MSNGNTRNTTARDAPPPNSGRRAATTNRESSRTISVRRTGARKIGLGDIHASKSDPTTRAPHASPSDPPRTPRLEYVSRRNDVGGPERNRADRSAHERSKDAADADEGRHVREPLE